MGGAMNWLYHNRAIFPDCYPHEEPQVQTVPWKEFPHAQMARWTTDFDCGHKTQWWYCIKDSAFDLAALNAKRRYEINKGNRNFETRLIDPAQHRDELYAVYENSLLGYDPGDRPQVSKKQFDAKIDNWNSIPEARIFGVFDRESGALCGYADVYERGRYLPISSMKTRVDCEKRNVNFALVYGILIHYERQLSSTLTPGGGYYLCDGQRNIRHQTNFQEFLVKYFGFRYAYCTLHVAYRGPMKLAVRLLYPFRRMLEGAKDCRIKMIASVLRQEELARSFRK